MVRHFMEIRGIGIIDIRAMYGIGSVILTKSIDLVIHLEMWVKDREYDRLGLHEEYMTIMGVKVPLMVIPVQPGRNLAIVIEVAARNLTLKRTGYNAAAELDKRLVEMLNRDKE
jgi:HPr kinase/phosphorylase